MVLRVLDLASGFPAGPRAKPDDQGQPDQHIRILFDRPPPRTDDLAESRHVELRPRADGELVDQAPQRVRPPYPDDVRGVPVDHRVQVVAKGLLSPSKRESPDTGKAALEDEVV